MKRSLAKHLSDMVFRRRDRRSKKVDAGRDADRASQIPNRMGPEHDCSPETEKDWAYVGIDEEGTPVYLDKGRIVSQSGSAPARIWLKHIPTEKASSFKQAQQYLREIGANWRSFCHIEQLIDVDLEGDRVSDLVLFFFDRNGRLIHEVRFQETTNRPFGTEAVYSAIKGIVGGLTILSDNRPASASDQPSIDERIEIKLQEINSALEAFDTCGDRTDPDVSVPSKSKPSH